MKSRLLVTVVYVHARQKASKSNKTKHRHLCKRLNFWRLNMQMKKTIQIVKQSDSHCQLTSSSLILSYLPVESQAGEKPLLNAASSLCRLPFIVPCLTIVFLFLRINPASACHLLLSCCLCLSLSLPYFIHESKARVSAVRKAGYK